MSTLRIDDMLRRHEAGEALQEIADAYGVSRQRIHQILKKAGAEMRGTRTETKPRGLIPYAGKERA